MKIGYLIETRVDLLTVRSHCGLFWIAPLAQQRGNANARTSQHQENRYTGAKMHATESASGRTPPEVVIVQMPIPLSKTSLLKRARLCTIGTDELHMARRPGTN